MAGVAQPGINGITACRSRKLRRRNIAISVAILGILSRIRRTWLSSERVRALGRMQIELAAGISHELRTPLAVIRSAGYNLAAGNVTSREDVVRYGNLFQDQGRRLSEIVDRLYCLLKVIQEKTTMLWNLRSHGYR